MEGDRLNTNIGSWEEKSTKFQLSTISFSLLFLLPLNYVILHYFIHFLDFSLNTYLVLIYRFGVSPAQGSMSSGISDQITFAMHLSRVLIPSVKFRVLLTASTISVGIFPWD